MAVELSDLETGFYCSDDIPVIHNTAYTKNLMAYTATKEELCYIDSILCARYTEGSIVEYKNIRIKGFNSILISPLNSYLVIVNNGEAEARVVLGKHLIEIIEKEG